jgi:uncharacterized membrane protein YraQ (UPF0718 family)
MTLFLLLMAIFGWLAAFICMAIVIIVAMAMGAHEELMKEQIKNTIEQTKKTRTLMWSPNKEKEIPFGD